jgi:putative heme-binding domain-containing protein
MKGVMSRMFSRQVTAAVAAWCLTAISVAAQQSPQEHPGQYSQADIEAGSRLYSSQCQQCHGLNGDQITGIDLRRGQFRRSTSDEDLAKVITTGVAGTAMPPFSLQAPEVSHVIAFIRAGFDPAGTAVKVGNAARGRQLFEGKGTCTSCHRVNGVGPRLAPDLSDVGAARTPATLQRALLEPSAVMLPINRPVRIAMKDGRTLTGRRVNEDTFTVQLIDQQERLLSLDKNDIKSLDVQTTSPMPSFNGKLTPEEMSDVIAYLITLKG